MSPSIGLRLKLKLDRRDFGRLTGVPVVRNRIANFNYALTILQSSMSDINIFSTKHLYDRIVSLSQINACTKIAPETSS